MPFVILLASIIIYFVVALITYYKITNIDGQNNQIINIIYKKQKLNKSDQNILFEKTNKKRVRS